MFCLFVLFTVVLVVPSGGCPSTAAQPESPHESSRQWKKRELFLIRNDKHGHFY